MNEESNAAPRGSALAQLGNLFVAPAQALDFADRRAKMLWLPLLITLACQAALGAWFALTVNLGSWRAAILQGIAARNPEAASHAAQMYAHHGRAILLGQFAGGGVVWLLIIELLFALYLFLADKIFSADSRGYGRWFSFTAWTSLPMALGSIAGMVAWALSNHAANFDLLAVTSLNTLFFHLHPGDAYYRLAQFSILQFWTIGLMVFGLKRWCRHGTSKALGIALAPYVVVYGLLFLF